jgi:hypothetical protein
MLTVNTKIDKLLIKLPRCYLDVHIYKNYIYIYIYMTPKNRSYQLNEIKRFSVKKTISFY